MNHLTVDDVVAYHHQEVDLLLHPLFLYIINIIQHIIIIQDQDHLFQQHIIIPQSSIIEITIVSHLRTMIYIKRGHYHLQDNLQPRQLPCKKTYFLFFFNKRHVYFLE